MKNLSNSLKRTLVLDPDVYTSSNASSSIDIQGFSSNQMVIIVGQSGDSLSSSVHWDFKLQDSDSSSSGFSDVSSSNLFESSSTITVDSSSDDQKSYSFNYRGSKRYLRVNSSATGTHTNGTPFSILAIQSHAGNQPV